MDLRQRANIIVDTCLGIKSKEKLLIITSEKLANQSKLLAEEAKTLGAEVTIHQIKSYKEMEIEPPDEVKKLMLNSDVVIASLPLYLLQIFSHTNARKATTDKGSRVVTIGRLISDIKKEDILKISELTDKLANILTNGKNVRITTKKGTDVTFSIKDRISAPLRVRHVTPGSWGAAPEYSEAAIAPVEGTAQGIAIIDVFFERIGAIKEPVKWTIENGRVLKVEGGEEAKKIKQIINEADENGNNLAELGIGTNHRVKDITDNIGSKMALGTAHLAIGKNINIGGQTYSNIHHDGVMQDVTIEIDKKLIIENGKVLI